MFKHVHFQILTPCPFKLHKHSQTSMYPNKPDSIRNKALNKYQTCMFFCLPLSLTGVAARSLRACLVCLVRSWGGTGTLTLVVRCCLATCNHQPMRSLWRKMCKIAYAFSLYHTRSFKNICQLLPGNRCFFSKFWLMTAVKWNVKMHYGNISWQSAFMIVSSLDLAYVIAEEVVHLGKALIHSNRCLPQRFIHISRFIHFILTMHNSILWTFNNHRRHMQHHDKWNYWPPRVRSVTNVF